MTDALTSHTLDTRRATTHWLESGPADGPLMVLVHGWPSTGLIWRAQMEAFAAEGWRCVAPDLRGFGRSTPVDDVREATIENAVADLAELHDHLGREPAVWVGHDWGSIVVGALAGHEPARCRGVVLTSWAYFPQANSLETLTSLVDRSIYPADEYPDGQWDYARYYRTHFDSAVADLDADPAATLAGVYRSGRASDVGMVSPSATVTARGGRYGDAHQAPPTEPDPALWPAADLDRLVQDFARTGFRGPCAYYVNDAANVAYARTAPREGRLRMPVLFVNGDWDLICSISGDRQGDPMIEACDDLTVAHLAAGHWLPLECKTELTDVVRGWIDEHR